MLFKLIFLGVFALLSTGCTSHKWQGFYYPDGCLSCSDEYIFSPIFSSLGECRIWANQTRAKRNNNPNDDYECGKDCSNNGGINICDETLR